MSKIKDEEFKKLRQLLRELEMEKINFANNNLKIKNLEKSSEDIYQKILAKSNNYTEYLQYLNEVYGDVKVDFNTGDIIQE